MSTEHYDAVIAGTGADQVRGAVFVDGPLPAFEPRSTP